jgi:hypothetical protein
VAVDIEDDISYHLQHAENKAPLIEAGSSALSGRAK